MRKDENIAILDLGSNSIRVVVIAVDHRNSYKMIDEFRNMVRLSKGLGEGNLLTDEAMDRTIETLKSFKNMITSHYVTKIIAVATAAVRNAANGPAFLARIQAETGFDFEIITGEEEAYLDYLGVINSIAIEDCLIVDTGGGSTELILVENRQIQHSISLPYGAVTLLEEFFSNEELERSELKRASDFIKNLYKSLPWLKEKKGLPIVGLGGSIRSLGKIYKRSFDPLRPPLHNVRLDKEAVNKIFTLISETKKTERKEIQGLKKERADTIVAGLLPLKIVMEYIKADDLIISGSGLREGAFYQYYFAKMNSAEKIVDDVLEHCLTNLMLKYDVDIEHSHVIKTLSMDVFAQLQHVHGLDDDYKKVLGVGALLHDIGLLIDYDNHHYHGFYLALNSGLNGLIYEELIMSAFIIALHRNEDFRLDVTEYIKFIGEEKYLIAVKLAMLVRVVEEICKSQNGSITKIECNCTKDNITFIPYKKDGTVVQLPQTLQSEKPFKKLFF